MSMLVCMTAVDDVTFVRRDVSRVRSQVVDDRMNLNSNAESTSLLRRRTEGGHV